MIFFKHYNDGQNDLFEGESVDFATFEKILKYTFSVNKFGEYYNFEHSDEIVEDVLKNVRSKFRPSG